MYFQSISFNARLLDRSFRCRTLDSDCETGGRLSKTELLTLSACDTGKSGNASNGKEVNGFRHDRGIKGRQGGHFFTLVRERRKHRPIDGPTVRARWKKWGRYARRSSICCSAGWGNQGATSARGFKAGRWYTCWAASLPATAPHLAAAFWPCAPRRNQR
jgi:hypothetical protein